MIGATPGCCTRLMEEVVSHCCLLNLREVSHSVRVLVVCVYNKMSGVLEI